MSTLTLGIDVGTTGTKVVLLDADRGVVAQATYSTLLHSDGPGFAEASPAQWLDNVYAAVSDVISQSGRNSRDVVGIATSGMVPAVVLLDQNKQPLRAAMLQNDARAVVEIDALALLLEGVDCVADTGSSLSQQWVAPSAMWLQSHEPDVWANAVTILGSYDYVLVALGAEPHVEQNWALESGLFYIDGRPHETIRAAAKIPSTLIPRVVRAGDQVGVLTAEAASKMGLAAGIPLIAGGADHVLSAYGAGVSRPGDWLIKLGGAGDILVNTDTQVVDKRLYLDAHPVPGGWLPNGCMATSGSLIRWFQSIATIDDLAEMDTRTEASDPGSILCLPYFLGEKSPLHDPDLRGAFFGMHLGTTREDLYRSVLEAIAFGFRHHRDIFTELGVALTRAMVTNGGSKSTLWKQIHADVLNTELYPVVDHPGASLGAAVIAAVGTGHLDSLTEIERFVTLGEPVVPHPDNVAIYDDIYPKWRALGDVTTPIAHHIARRSRA